MNFRKRSFRSRNKPDFGRKKEQLRGNTTLRNYPPQHPLPRLTRPDYTVKMPCNSSRRWLPFRLPTLLVVIAVVSISLVWAAKERRRSKLNRRQAEEGQRLVDASEKRIAADKVEQAAFDELVGQPAPELPDSEWVNTSPKTWPSLRGKVVVLDFCAVWCGACRRDLPLARSIHQMPAESGIVVIGVHATDAKGTVEEFAKEENLRYPILIDLPPPDPDRAFGLLFSQLRVRSIPYSFLIDQEGKIAGHGALVQVLEQAKDLAAADRSEFR